jgi:hypothetical protein
MQDQKTAINPIKAFREKVGYDHLLALKKTYLPEAETKIKKFMELLEGKKCKQGRSKKKSNRTSNKKALGKYIDAESKTELGIPGYMVLATADQIEKMIVWLIKAYDTAKITKQQFQLAMFGPANAREKFMGYLLLFGEQISNVHYQEYLQKIEIAKNYYAKHGKKNWVSEVLGANALSDEEFNKLIRMGGDEPFEHVYNYFFFAMLSDDVISKNPLNSKEPIKNRLEKMKGLFKNLSYDQYQRLLNIKVGEYSVQQCLQELGVWELIHAHGQSVYKSTESGELPPNSATETYQNKIQYAGFLFIKEQEESGFIKRTQDLTEYLNKSNKAEIIKALTEANKMPLGVLRYVLLSSPKDAKAYFDSVKSAYYRKTISKPQYIDLMFGPEQYGKALCRGEILPYALLFSDVKVLSLYEDFIFKMSQNKLIDSTQYMRFINFGNGDFLVAQTTALYCALISGSYEKITYFIDRYRLYSAAMFNMSPELNASGKSNEELIDDFLFDLLASPKDGFSPICYLKESENIECALKLLVYINKNFPLRYNEFLQLAGVNIGGLKPEVKMSRLTMKAVESVAKGPKVSAATSVKPFNLFSQAKKIIDVSAYLDFVSEEYAKQRATSEQVTKLLDVRQIDFAYFNKVENNASKYLHKYLKLCEHILGLDYLQKKIILFIPQLQCEKEEKSTNEVTLKNARKAVEKILKIFGGQPNCFEFLEKMELRLQDCLLTLVKQNPDNFDIGLLVDLASQSYKQPILDQIKIQQLKQKQQAALATTQSTEDADSVPVREDPRASPVCGDKSPQSPTPDPVTASSLQDVSSQESEGWSKVEYSNRKKTKSKSPCKGRKNQQPASVNKWPVVQQKPFEVGAIHLSRPVSSQLPYADALKGKGSISPLSTTSSISPLSSLMPESSTPIPYSSDSDAPSSSSPTSVGFFAGTKQQSSTRELEQAIKPKTKSSISPAAVLKDAKKVPLQIEPFFESMQSTIHGWLSAKPVDMGNEEYFIILSSKIQGYLSALKDGNMVRFHSILKGEACFTSVSGSRVSLLGYLLQVDPGGALIHGYFNLCQQLYFDYSEWISVFLNGQIIRNEFVDAMELGERTQVARNWFVVQFGMQFKEPQIAMDRFVESVNFLQQKRFESSRHLMSGKTMGPKPTI